jgi:hypothetical protein
MNRAIFFSAIRRTLFSRLRQSQVDGVNATLKAWELWAPKSDLRFVAYSLATQYWETGKTMQPIAEIGHGRGRAYGSPAGPWRQTYYGRGDIQLTWQRNYAFAEQKLRERGVLKGTESLVETPDLALRADVAAAIMVLGMSEGWFTGRKLGDFFAGSKADWVNARTIINGHDRATVIASFALSFFNALEDARKVAAPSGSSVVQMETLRMKGYRTYAAAGLTGLFGLLASTDWVAFLSDPKAGAVAMGSAVLMAVMRSVTTTAPGQNV